MKLLGQFPAVHWSSSPFARLLSPMQEFIHHSAASGIILMGATVVALILANSALAEQYQVVLHTYLGFSVGPFTLEETLLHWINDGLMAIFFLLVGLEIKREILVGELSNIRAALLPIIAALGGAIVPAAIYLAFNPDGPGSAGWGIPMATDIAFVLGLLALLGPRVPFALKIFLTAVAIVDDLIAVLVIAIFYSSGVNFTALAIGIGLLTFLLLANLVGVRSLLVYALVGLVVWLAFFKSGVHSTIAGVLLAWTIPARNRIDPAVFLDRSHAILDRFRQASVKPTPTMTDEVQQYAVIQLEEVCEHVQAPLQKLEHLLHRWVSFLIMPVFALANAGVLLSLQSLAGETLPMGLGIIMGLILGKPIGLLGSAWLAIRTGLVSLPQDVRWRHMIGAAFLAGIGFTMSLFIAALAFDDELLAAAKLGILVASILAGGIGFILLARKPANHV